MNKHEAIEKIKNIDTLNINDIFAGQSVDMDIKNQVIDLISKIDEPQKPVVPKFVANWYEENKDNFEYNVQCLCVHNCEPLREIDIWFDSDDTKPVETLVMMHKFGYEIEKEKLYTVEIPNPNRTTEPIIFLSRDERGKIFLNNWFLYVGQNWKNRPHAHLTESEIKKDFEWAWNAGFAKEVE